MGSRVRFARLYQRDGLDNKINVNPSPIEYQGSYLNVELKHHRANIVHGRDLLVLVASGRLGIIRSEHPTWGYIACLSLVGQFLGLHEEPLDPFPQL